MQRKALSFTKLPSCWGFSIRHTQTFNDPIKEQGGLSEAQLRFNKKLSSAWVTIENAFGLLKRRFRRLKYVDPDIKRIPRIVKACCVLYNIQLCYPEDLYFLEGEGMPDLNENSNDWEPADSPEMQQQERVLKRMDIVRRL